MSDVYLVRHGQAGTRDAYDSLSELGKRQSRLLGEYFVSRGVRFAAACVGALCRQQQTADEVRAAYAHASVSFPAVIVDPGWDEFDLRQLDREIAPQLCAEDPDFRREYEAMREQLRTSEGERRERIHRRWLPCDTKVVDAWIRGRYPYSGETWAQFCERVMACRLRMADVPRQENIIVFTSAAPIAIWTGASLDVIDDRVMRLAGAQYNASYTMLRLREGQPRLLMFNAIPHLEASELCTRR